MKAVVITRFGGPETLELRDVPDPSFGPDEVLVRVRASALNRADLLQRRGLYPAPPGAPAEVPGLEFAGEVLDAGSRVTGLQRGDRVMGLLGGGGHAEKIAVHARMCLRIPPSLSFEEAGAVPEAFMTAFDAVVVRGKLAPGEAILLTAAGSGVGTAAAGIALACGARVFATSRSPDKRSRLERLGVEGVLDPSVDDLPGRLRLLSGGDGVDLAVDFVGAAAIPAILDALAPKGRLVIVGTLSGSRVEFDLGLLMRRRLTVTGTVLRSRPIEEKIALTQEFGRTILPMIAAGRLRAIVDRIVPLAEVAAAHGAMERNETFGKIVLSV